MLEKCTNPHPPAMNQGCVLYCVSFHAGDQTVTHTDSSLWGYSTPVLEDPSFLSSHGLCIFASSRACLCMKCERNVPFVMFIGRKMLSSPGHSTHFQATESLDCGTRCHSVSEMSARGSFRSRCYAGGANLARSAGLQHEFSE